MTSGFCGSVNAAAFTVDEKGKKHEIKHGCGVSCKQDRVKQYVEEYIGQGDYGGISKKVRQQYWWVRYEPKTHIWSFVVTSLNH